MNLRTGWTGKVDERAGQAADPVLEQALRNFRQSVHAWSEAAYSQPRPVAVAARQGSWRLAAGWALGCVLAAGSVAGGVYEQRHHRQEAARTTAPAQTPAVRQQQQAPAAAPAAREEDEDLLAKVNSDVSRQVSSAMEPLAQLMAEDETE